MTQVKIFYSSYIDNLQQSANNWLEKNNEKIINVSVGPISIYNGDKYLTITYSTIEHIEFEKVEPIAFLSNNG